METIILVIMMAVIGSVIGGVTNMLAIKMLFKPYEPKFLFGLQLPFTPGVIPKRRNEASVKLGKIIMNHLLTPEVFIEKIQSEKSQEFMILFIDQQIKTIEEERLTPRYVLERIHPGLSDTIIKGINAEIEQHVNQFGHEIYDVKLSHLIPNDATTLLDTYADTLHEHFIVKVYQYVTSDRGYHDLYVMIDEFIENRGKLANSLKLFFSKDTLTQRAQAEITKLITHEKMQDILQAFIKIEYENLKQKKLSDYISNSDKTHIFNRTSKYVQGEINISGKLDTPIMDLNKDLFERFKDSGKYELRNHIVNYMSKHFVKILDKLQLAEVIKTQIDNFELSKIERLVLEVSSKELRMIAVLGFVLGGIIGTVQGVIVIFL